MSKAASMEFEFACDIYLYDIEPRVRETTLEQKRYCIESTLKPYFQSAPAGDIDAKAVIDWGGGITYWIAVPPCSCPWAGALDSGASQTRRRDSDAPLHPPDTRCREGDRKRARRGNGP